MHSQIQVVLASDARYAMPLAVTMCSTAANCSPDRTITFTVIHEAIDSNLSSKVQLSVELVKPGTTVNWISVPKGALSDLRVVHAHMTPLIYARLLIPDLLPKSCTRVIYLDSDLVVEGDISSLWDSNLQSRSLGAVRDRIDIVGNPGGLRNHRELGIDPKAPYFNSGVLIMDLVRWRDLGISPRVFEYIREHSKEIQMGDQDGLNAVLHDDWTELHQKWNQQIVPRAFRPFPSAPALPQHHQAGIVHFITGEKPWLPDCSFPERTVFFQYLDRTAWAGWRIPVWRELLSKFRRAVRATRRILAPFRSPDTLLRGNSQ